MVGFSETQIKKARDFYIVLCYPTVKCLINMLIRNKLMNCSVTLEEIENPVNICVPDFHYF